MRGLATQMDALGRGIDFPVRGVASGHIRPIIAREFALAEIAGAHRYMESGEHIGKIVVRAS